MSDTPTVGYVGLGHHHAGPYLQTLASLPVTVTCASAPTVEAVPDVPALPDVPVYDELEALLDAEAVDVVWLSLPNRETPAAIETATARGVDVFTEKPAARTAADLRPVVERLRDRDATVCPAYVWRAHPIALELRARAETDFFGAVRHVEARYVASHLRHRDVNHYLFERKASRGGILQWLGVHWLDLVPWVLGDPIVAVRARTTTPVSPTVADDVDVEDGVTVEFETERGAMGNLTCGYYLREGRYDTEIRVYGEAGHASWDPMGPEFGFEGDTSVELTATDGSWPSSPTRTLEYEYDPVPGYAGGWGREFVEAFFAARRDEGPLPATLEEALQVLDVLDAAYEAADTGTWVRVGRT